MQALTQLLGVFHDRPSTHEGKANSLSVVFYQALMRIVGCFDTVLQRNRDWRARRRALRVLHQLSDHVLCDIGMERIELEDVVHRRHQQELRSKTVRKTPESQTLGIFKDAEKTPRNAANDSSWDTAA